MFAETNQWDYPASLESLVLMNLFDRTGQIASPKKPPAPHPRPWVEKPQTVSRGNAAGRTPEEMKAILRTHFGQRQAPV